MKIIDKNSVVFILFYLVVIIAAAAAAFWFMSSKLPKASETTAAETSASTETTTETTTEMTTADIIESQIAEMPLDEKIGQMIFVAYRSESEGFSVTHGSDALAAEIDKYGFGGFVLFDENIADCRQTREYIEFLNKSSKIPPFIAVDEEGGIVSRIGNTGIVEGYYVPSARTMAAQGEECVRQNYKTIADTLKDLGFNMDLAPVADVDTNPNNPIIGDRSFGRDTDTVCRMMYAAAETLEENGVIPVVKHFPGHGDTQTDTHKGVSILTHDMARLESVELVPFKYAAEKGLPAVMVSHITAEACGELPSSLNKTVITDILRGKLGFDGIVITDAMDMGAIADNYGCGEAAVMAIEAGADILLMPPDVHTAVSAVKQAVENGRLDEKQIDRSLYRILTLKNKYNIKNGEN